VPVIVKCHYQTLQPHDFFHIDQVWLFENCSPDEGEEIFVWWHARGKQAAHLAIRGSLLRFEPRGKSPTNHRPVASLQIRVAGQIENGPTLDNLVAESNLLRKLHEAGWTKVASLDPQEVDYLRRFFHDQRPNDDAGAIEGYSGDQTVSFLTRNRAKIAERKRYDGYRCQACQFRLEVRQGRFIIDCHHKHPLTDVTVTWLDDLVCLCPTCHRIAHTRKSPLTVDEIQAVRAANGLPLRVDVS
jgi:hypothetical protein